MSKRIAIIGAGMAGLAAARELAAAGHGVTLFDKSRGLGGRMATRRVEGLHFDHGAQFFTAKSSVFRVLVAEWESAGHAAEWSPGYFVGMPGMTAPARAMAGAHDFVSGCQVSALRREARGWTVATTNGPVETPGNGAFAAVVLAVPAPQAVPLAASAGVPLPGAEQVRYAPCWALMLAFAAPVLAEDHLRPGDEAIAWIARNATKPGRDATRETIVVHATPGWSRVHLEDSPDAVAAMLLARFRGLTGAGEPAYAAAHRWRYALVEQPLGLPFLWDDAAGLGACGDWCLGPRVEAAFESGCAMGQAALHALEMRLAS